MMTQGLKPTDEQQAIIEAAAKPGSIFTRAYAGCTKTTTLQLAGQVIKVPALSLAFNKKIALELQKRFAGNFTVKTMNGLGHGAWARGLAVAKVELDARKLGKLVSQVAKDRKVELSSDQWTAIRDLVGKVMQAGISPGDAGEPLLPDTRENWLAIAEDLLWLSPDEFDFLYDLAREVLEQNIALARKGIISFDDQVYCPTVLGGRWPKFPVVLVDEAQDLSPLNHRMIELAQAPGAKLLVVGDEKQAIYAFRGATSDSMARLRALRPAWSELPLTMTFRCPKEIVARQQRHAPGFRAAQANRPGEIRRIELTEGQKALGEGWTWGQVAPPNGTIAVLCRNNGPLLALAFKLLRKGIGVVMLGRDIGKGLERLSREIAKDDGLPAAKVAGLIEDWRQREVSLAQANGKEERVAGITDRAECLQAVLSNASCVTAGDLRAMLAKLFARDSGPVELSSIHRAKGLEWQTVLHLDPWRIPSKWAKQAARDGDSSQLQQEWNLKYVCETRTKDVLIEANLEDFLG